jgi:CHAT domain-containing protein/Tfp pilus assembly protein PilF
MRAVFAFVIILASSAMLPGVADAQDNLQRLAAALEKASQLEKAGRTAEAFTANQTALDLARKVFGQDHTTCAAILMSLGNLKRAAGDYEAAEPFLKEGIQICKKQKDRELELEITLSLASSLVERGKHADALDLMTRVLAMSESLHGPSSSQTATVLGNLGDLYRALGRDEEAEKVTLRAIAVLEKIPAQASVLAANLKNLGNVYAARGDFLKAESTFHRALAMSERTAGRNSTEVAFVRNNLGVLYQGIGLWQKAEQMHRETLKTLEVTLGPDHPNVATSHNNLAIVLDEQKRYAEAEPNYRRSLEIRQARLGKDDPATSLSMQSLGGFLTGQKRFDEAETLLQDCLTLRKQTLGEAHPSVADAYSSLAFLRYRQGKFDEALEFHRQQLAINTAALSGSHPRIGAAYVGIGDTETSMKHWTEAATAFGEARKIARRYIDSVLPGLSEPEQLVFLKETDEPQFHRAISLAVEVQDAAITDATAEWVVNGKAVSQQALAQRVLLMRNALDQTVASLANNVRDLRKRLAAALHAGGANQSKQQAEVAELTKREQESSRQLAEKTGQSASASKWVDLPTLRARIPQNAVVVEIVRFDRFNHLQNEPLPDAARYGAWMIPPAEGGAVQFIDLGLANEIDNAVSEARKELQGSIAKLKEAGESEAESALKPVLEKLSARVLQPIVAKLQHRTLIYLSPDSQLWIVPWSALPLADGTYAVEKLDIRYLVSSRDLVHDEIKLSAGRAVMMADPNYDLDPAGVKAAVQSLLGKRQAVTSAVSLSGTSKLGVAPRLPGTRLEAQAIEPKVREITGSDPQLWVDQFALEQAFKGMRQPRLLVVCTHGFFQEENEASRAGSGPSSLGAAIFVNPLVRCGLLLAGCNKPDRSNSSDSEDGILTGIEIVETDLRGTELVVLSACETGLGDIKNGQGVSGLRQAFQLAGARSVISTLWQIPDLQSARLMRDFFANLAESGDKAKSLRDAQLSLIESRRNRYGAAHPFFWAAFTLTGE